MVDVGMREKDRAQGLRFETQVAVSPNRFLPAALKESAIKQQSKAWHIQQMPTPRD
jgi:hypothetical protein